MDGQRFDQLARAFANGASRRRLVQGLVGGALAAAATRVRTPSARAQCSWSGTFQATFGSDATVTLTAVGDEVSGSYTFPEDTAVLNGTITGVVRTDFPGYTVLDGFWQEPDGGGRLWLSMPLDTCSQFTGSYTETDASEEWIAGWDGVRTSEGDGGEGGGDVEGGGGGGVEGDGSGDIEGETAVSCEGHGDCQLALSPCHACDLTGHCRAVACNQFDCPCPAGQICSFFTCVSACMTDADCPADLVCDCHDDEGRCQEVGHCARACLSDSDCPPGDVCPDWSGTCVPACATIDALRGCVSTCATVDHECDTVDVVVVGAGLSGLTAAWKLAQAQRTVAVLEAQDHVGGRMIRQQVGQDANGQGVYVDLGGQWIGPEQKRIIALANDAGRDVVGLGRQGCRPGA